MPFNVGGYIINSGIAAVADYSSVVQRGLILALDASSLASYPGSGTTIYDLMGNANGTVNGSISFVSSNQASYFNFATANDSNYISSTVSQNYLDFTAVFQPDFSRSGQASIAGLIGTNTAASGADKSLRFDNVNGTGPWNITSRNPGDGNDWAYPSGTTYYVNGSASNTLVSGWNIFGGYRTNQSGFSANFSYYLGSSGYASRGFQGKLAAIFMYSRQLTATEQLYNYNILKTRFGLT
jgi:hypothetical protein